MEQSKIIDTLETYHGRGCRGGRGRGARGGAVIVPLPVVPPAMEGHVGDRPRKFFIRLRRPPHRRRRLPTTITAEMELDPPQTLRLQLFYREPRPEPSTLRRQH